MFDFNQSNSVQMRVFGYIIIVAAVELLSFTFEDGKHTVTVHKEI